MEDIKQKIRHLVFRGEAKQPAADLEKRIARDAGVSKNLVRRAFKELIGQGELQYTYVHGTSFLEPSFNRPVHVSKRIVLKPPDRAYQQKRGEVVIALAGGAAFGNGAHPTTCLALQALDESFGEVSTFPLHSALTGLDVGTGTGILAVALAKLTALNVVGVDIDPRAVFEARENVSLNGLSRRVTISNTRPEDLVGPYAVIMGNLAYPTLEIMSPLFRSRLETHGTLILSGFKVNALEALREAYASRGFIPVWERPDRGWACLVFRKPARL